jgi:signal transduction histidine kinase
MAESNLLPGSLEWWHIILSILLLVITLALRAVKVFGDSFARWADKLDAFQASINARLTAMEQDFAMRMTDMQVKFQLNEDRVHNLTLRVERRVTRLEERLRIAQEKWYRQGDGDEADD